MFALELHAVADLVELDIIVQFHVIFTGNAETIPYILF
jgi:hypothetical protein